MSFEVIFVLGLVVVVFGAFFWEKFPPEVIALASVAALLIVDIVDTDEFLSVFSSSAPITIAMMFIISAALERTGVLEAVGSILQSWATGSVLRAMAVTMFFVMVASAFMNNTPIVILMTPVVISLASSLNVAPSKLLIPLSFASIFGGTLTLVGTSTNILMNTVAKQAGQPAISMFEMTMPGLIFAAVGIAYMVFVGRFLLPDRFSLKGLIAEQPSRQFIVEVLIPKRSKLVGKSLKDFALKEREASIIDVIRNNHSLIHALGKVVLQGGDRLVLQTNAGSIVGLKENGQIMFLSEENDYEPVAADETVLVQASVGLRSSLIGKTVDRLYLSRRYGIYLLGVHRNEESISEKLENIRLKFGDTLMLEGSATGIKRLLEGGDVIDLDHPQERPIRRAKAPIALIVIGLVMTLAAFEVMPIAGLAVIGAVVVLMTGCIDAEEAFDAIDWRILFLIFGMLGLSLGLENSGAAEIIVKIVVNLTQNVGPLGILLAVYILTSTLTEMISNNAVAVLLGPIVIGLAVQLGYDPRPFIMAVLFAASASFATPIGYQTNTFVYGAGGYKFADFLKVGLPLNIIFAGLAAVILPLFFPF